VLAVSREQRQECANFLVSVLRREPQQNQTWDRPSVANGKLAEVLVFCDEDAILVPAERQKCVVISAAIGLEHVVDIMPCVTKRGDQARIAALVEQ
jgi:hypothetical protein